MTGWMMPLLAILLAMTGCQTGDFSEQPSQPVSSQLSSPAEPVHSEPLVLREGNVVNVTFPGSSSLDTSQQIRSDGRIVMPLIGEVTAAGLTPEELQNELIKLYAPQVQTKQVVVTLQSSGFPIYVTGAVLKPGMIDADHPMSVLEAIMDAGGFDPTTANLKAVVVVRQGKDGTTKFTVNVKNMMNGGKEKPFYLQPADMVYVPVKFTWF